MIIASPGDCIELKACIQYLANKPQPSYLRLDKSSNYKIHKKNEIISGKWIKVYDSKLKNKKNIYLTTGAVIEYVKNKITKKKLKILIYTQFHYGV